MSLSRIRPLLRPPRPSIPSTRPTPLTLPSLHLRPLNGVPPPRSRLLHTHLRPHHLHPSLTSHLRALRALHPTLYKTQTRLLTLPSDTKRYLKEQAHLAFTLVFYGYAFLFLLAWLAFGTVQVYLENQRSTPEIFDFWTRTLIRNGRMMAEWSFNFLSACMYFKDAVEEQLKLRKEGKVQESEGWRRAVKETCWEWVGMEEKARDVRGQRKALETLLGMEWVKGGERSRGLTKLAGVLEMMVEGDDVVRGTYEEAVKVAAEEVAGKSQGLGPVMVEGQVGVLKAGSEKAVTSELLDACTELAIFHARRKSLSLALPIFLSVLRTRESSSTFSDPCENGKLMSYIAEMLYSSGRKKEGISWNERSLNLTVPLVELRRKCKDCAVYATGNSVLMWEGMGSLERTEEARKLLMKLEAIRVSRYD